MAQVDYFNSTNFFDAQKRKIRYTQFISSMLATRDGKSYQSVQEYIYHPENFSLMGGMPNGGGVSENMPAYGSNNSQPFNSFAGPQNSERDHLGNFLLTPPGEISLRKRWRQARSLTSHPSVTDLTGTQDDGHPQAQPFYMILRQQVKTLMILL